jgi:hypothetical protein
MKATDYEQLLERIDSTLENRVVVYGSVPPNARDLDLLARPDDADAIGRALREDGFATSNRMFVAFRGCTALVVEVIPAARLGLPPAELDALYAEAVPLGRLANVAEPSPHHSLLILARRHAAERVLQTKHRVRIDRAVASDAHAWQRAHNSAAGWSAQRALERLRSLYMGQDLPSRRRRPPTFRRTRIVGLSGPDAARTRSHADSLEEAVARLGFDPLVVEPSRRAWERRLGSIGTAVALWRPVWRHLGLGRVLIYDLSTMPESRQGKSLSGLSPRPGYQIVIDPSRPRDAVCEELGEAVWRALVHRNRMDTRARQLVRVVRRRLSRAGPD